jgi:hypothetical protein
MDKFSPKFQRSHDVEAQDAAEAANGRGANELAVLGELELMLASGGDGIPSWG